MNFLVPLAGLLGIEVEALTERVKRTIIVNAVMAALVATGLLFLLIAGYLTLSDVLGPVLAALIFGGAFLLLALAVFIGTRIGDSRRRREIADKRRASETGAFLTTAALTALPALPVLLKSPMVRTLGLPAVAIAAFLLARRADDDKT